MSLSEKRALITGGGTGIGAAIALALAKAGALVAIAGRREEKLAQVADASGEKMLTHVVDVAERQSVADLFEWAGTELGPIDILVNSAGVNIPARLMSELDPANWDLLMQVNATGAYNCMRAVLPQMRQREDGLIVNISSVAGKRAVMLGGVAYNASKFAMTALGMSVAQEEKDNGIRITNIYPGEVETPILEARPVAPTEEHLARMLQPEDVAAAVLMVANLPPRANVAELVIKPTTQAFC